MDEHTARISGIEGLPTLIVTGVIAPAEPEVGIWDEYLFDLTWEAADGDLTPEQEELAFEQRDALADAFMAAVEERRRDDYEAEISAEIEQRANGAW